MRTAALVLVLGLCAGPLLAQRRGEPAAAPAPRVCVVVIDSMARATAQGQNYFGGGGVLAHCQNQPTTMSSDSLVWFAQENELRMIGNVHFRDSTAVLDADHLTYWRLTERLYAIGNVYTRNLGTGSDLRGPNLDYYRTAPGIRDTVELIASGRPTIHFFPTRDSTATATDTVTPFTVIADRVRMKGNERMWGGGRVTLDRNALTARADSSMLDLGLDRGSLMGHPVVSDTGNGSYRLSGLRIAFELTEDNDVRRVIAQDSADADGPDWRMQADTLDLAVDSGAVQQAQAWGRRRRATAWSGVSTIDADSLDIRMPGQVVRLVWAFGSGRAVSDPDSTASDREPDWLSGDTLRARFASRDSVRAPRDTTRPAADSAARRPASEIEHITAFGSARAYYHVDNEREEGGPRGVSYSRGRRIDIAMRESRVNTVDVVGLVDGIYLEPMAPGAERDSVLAQAARQDSLAALRDSLAGTRRDSLTARPGAPAPAVPAADSARPATPRPPVPSTVPARPATPPPATPRPATLVPNPRRRP